MPTQQQSRPALRKGPTHPWQCNRCLLVVEVEKDRWGSAGVPEGWKFVEPPKGSNDKELHLRCKGCLEEVSRGSPEVL